MSHVRLSRFVALLVLVMVGSTIGSRVAAEEGKETYSIVTFGALALPGDKYTLTGSTNAPEGTVVTFTGIPGVEGAVATVDSQGNFLVIVTVPPGTGGNVIAIGQTPSGQRTNSASCNVSP